MAKVISVRNVYTGKEYNVCVRHNKSGVIGDVQTQMGRHDGVCFFCQGGFDLPDEKIESMRQEAALAGDKQTVKFCVRALNGVKNARAECFIMTHNARVE